MASGSCVVDLEFVRRVEAGSGLCWREHSLDCWLAGARCGYLREKAGSWASNRAHGGLAIVIVFVGRLDVVAMRISSMLKRSFVFVVVGRLEMCGDRCFSSGSDSLVLLTS